MHPIDSYISRLKVSVCCVMLFRICTVSYPHILMCKLATFKYCRGIYYICTSSSAIYYDSGTVTLREYLYVHSQPLPYYYFVLAHLSCMTLYEAIYTWLPPQLHSTFLSYYFAYNMSSYILYQICVLV